MFYDLFCVSFFKKCSKNATAPLSLSQAREKAMREKSDTTEDNSQLMETSSENGVESPGSGAESPPAATAGYSDENRSWLKPAKKSVEVVTKKTKKGGLLGKHSSRGGVSHPPISERLLMTYCSIYMNVDVSCSRCNLGI